MHQIEELLHCMSAFWPGQCSNFGALKETAKEPDDDARHSNSQYSYGSRREIPIKTSRQEQRSNGGD
ncbi:MAG: hypothetical protein JNK97_13290 [Zoogloea sp.]|nr:hypothetical protein [Zoogloea sp.]